MTDDEIREHNNQVQRELAEEREEEARQEERDKAEGRDPLLAGKTWTPEWEEK